MQPHSGGMGITMDIYENELNDSLEVMEFEIGENSYGINVAKVKEVVMYDSLTPTPDQHPCVEGILMLRGTPIPVINLAKRLKFAESADPENDLIIITIFNNLSVGLHVHSVNDILKLSWSEIEKPDATLQRNSNCIVTGIIKNDNRITILLDFEKIVADINPTTTIQVSDITEKSNDVFTSQPIMIVDDSPMLNKLIMQALKKAGFTSISSKSNGKEAWDALFSYKGSKNIRQIVSCVITDIEMPAMDGLTLCRKIKADSVLSQIPVILFSSIIDDSMKERGKEAGADAQISKPEINNLVNIIESLM